MACCSSGCNNSKYVLRTWTSCSRPALWQWFSHLMLQLNNLYASVRRPLGVSPKPAAAETFMRLPRCSRFGGPPLGAQVRYRRGVVRKPHSSTHRTTAPSSPPFLPDPARSSPGAREWIPRPVGPPAARASGARCPARAAAARDGRRGSRFRNGRGSRAARVGGSTGRWRIRPPRRRRAGCGAAPPAASRRASAAARSGGRPRRRIRGGRPSSACSRKVVGARCGPWIRNPCGMKPRGGDPTPKPRGPRLPFVAACEARLPCRFHLQASTDATQQQQQAIRELSALRSKRLSVYEVLERLDVRIDVVFAGQ